MAISTDVVIFPAIHHCLRPPSLSAFRVIQLNKSSVLRKTIERMKFLEHSNSNLRRTNADLVKLLQANGISVPANRGSIDVEYDQSEGDSPDSPMSGDASSPETSVRFFLSSFRQTNDSFCISVGRSHGDTYESTVVQRLAVNGRSVSSDIVHGHDVHDHFQSVPVDDRRRVRQRSSRRSFGAHRLFARAHFVIRLVAG